MSRPLSSNQDAGRAEYDYRDDIEGYESDYRDNLDSYDDEGGYDDDGGGGGEAKPVVALLETTRSTRASVQEGKAGQCSL